MELRVDIDVIDVNTLRQRTNVAAIPGRRVHRSRVGG